MRLIFMGTPDFAVPALDALVAAGHELLCVYTQPARAAGRGRKARPSPVQVAAERLGLTVRHPVDLKAEAEQAAFAALDADVAVVAAYGLILPRPVLEAPRHGCINIHASLLPRWRGAAPIQRAILAGDRESGVTIMQMEAGLDTGPMLLREAVPIDEATTGGMLHDRLAPLGARLIVDALRRLEAGTLVATQQPEEGATYARKIDKAETRIDWTEDAAAVLRRIRAFAPAPGAWCGIGGERVKILAATAATAADGGCPPGTVLDGGLAVACGSGAVRIATLQRAGRGPVDADAFLRGFAVPQGTCLS